MSEQFRPEKVDVEINEDCLVHCPAKRFKLHRATLCKDCDHFHGVIQIAAEGSRWDYVYRIGCEHVIFRRPEYIGED